MLLRIFNDESPLINTTDKREKQQANTESSSSAVSPVDGGAADKNAEKFHASAEAEDEAIEKEDLYLGEKEQERTNKRETWSMANGEEDRFNTTV